MNKAFLKTLLLIMAVIMTGCLNETGKQITNLANKAGMRIEFSTCINCKKCTKDFKCPRGAIRQNSFSNGMEIDAAKCINCGLCKSEFTCPVNAFSQTKDGIAPGVVKNFKIDVKDSSSVTCKWDPSGDDNYEGFAFKYALFISTAPIVNGQLELADRSIVVSNDLTVNIPNLTAGIKYYVGIIAEDEAGNSSDISVINVSL